ncbi:MAG: tetratricopeptide repeat protein [Lactobacillus sp.]|nr:tetratricopeptide repeat protein [Lactobacillus sp.]
MEKQAEKLYQQGDKQAAVKLLAQKLQQDMSHADWFLQLSGYLTAGGDFEQAEELLVKAKQLFPETQEIDYNLAVIYFEAGKLAESQKMLQNITDSTLVSDVYYLMAQQSLQQKQLPQALMYALTAYDKNPQLEDNSLLVGDICLQLKEFKRAQEYYQKAVKIKSSALVLFKLALTEMVLGEKSFQQHFAESQRIDPQYFQQHQQQLADIERYLKLQTKEDK